MKASVRKSVVMSAMVSVLIWSSFMAKSVDVNSGWQSMSDYIGATDKVYAIAKHENNIYVGGDFTAIGNTQANYIARWDGANWSPLGMGMNATVRSLACDSAGNLYAGGAPSSSIPNVICRPFGGLFSL